MAISRALAEDGYAITASARRPQKLEEAVAGLAADGFEVTAVPADVSSEDDIKALVAAHREKYGRLDVLVNNAGVGIGGAVEEAETKKIDMQIDVNLRSYVIAMREALPMLKEAGAEHGKALIVNTASIAGKGGQGWLAVYSATKAGVIGLSQATQMEVGKDGVQVTALCPAFVDTPMTEWVQGQVKPEEMIQPEDLAETVRLLLRTSRYCLIPEVVFSRPGDPSAFAT
ncbi:MAG: SDR family oxidoreductase [Solirubrobacterales bacterium]|nr:SDR family oxidoreductase [Solirubrobacterales bacterium]